MQALIALVRKDLITYFSNRRALLTTLAAPIAIAAFFGSLFGGSDDRQPSKVPIAIVDHDGSAISKRIVADLTADTTFEVQPLPEAAAEDAVRRGKLRALIALPAGFGAATPRALFGGGERPVIDIHFDPSQAITLQVVSGLLAKHVMEAVAATAFSFGDGDNQVMADARKDVEASSRMSAETKRDYLALFDSIERVQRPGDAAGVQPPAQRSPGFQMPYTTREIESVSRAATGSDARYNSYAHSFAGMGVQFILFMGIDLGIRLLTMRRLGLWMRLRAAPLSKLFLLGSQVASGALIAAILFALIFAAGMLFFGVRVEGSLAGFVLIIVAFALMTAGFGLFIAALGKTPEATRGLAIFATLLMVMLGGAWIPAFIFPRWLQTVSLVIPTRWAVDGLDAMTWRGLGFDAAWQPVLVLLGFALIFTVVAALRFDWDEK